MFIHKKQRFTIYFGDASQNITLDEINQKKAIGSLEKIAQKLNILQFVFLHQNHGVEGDVIQKSNAQSYFFQQSGDYLITKKKNCGIGVLTADCLSIVLYDPITQTAGIVHAGWRGSAAGILKIVIDRMVQDCGVFVDMMQMYLGPAARSCCYEVQQDFIKNFVHHENYQASFIQKDYKLYFDAAQFAVNIAQNLGIKDKNIYTTYNVCTICDTSFCSYRREKENACRQITLITLH